MSFAEQQVSDGLGKVLASARLFSDFSQPWIVSGGWAIDLFLGHTTRKHKDVDISVFRQDQLAVQSFLHGWQLYTAHDGKLALWPEGEYLELPYMGIWAWPPGAEAGKVESPPDMEVLLDERDATHWRYRRDQRITRPLERVCLWGGPLGDIPCLAPEVALLYKSKEPRTEDSHDFEVAWPEMDAER
ncbi:MAG: hypothetical protein ABIQ44_10780, partial [Chloroflexia bacterium]